jgi:hypothetical protein
MASTRSSGARRAAASLDDGRPHQGPRPAVDPSVTEDTRAADCLNQPLAVAECQLALEVLRLLERLGLDRLKERSLFFLTSRDFGEQLPQLAVQPGVAPVVRRRKQRSFLAQTLVSRLQTVAHQLGFARGRDRQHERVERPFRKVGRALQADIGRGIRVLPLGLLEGIQIEEATTHVRRRLGASGGDRELAASPRGAQDLPGRHVAQRVDQNLLGRTRRQRSA